MKRLERSCKLKVRNNGPAYTSMHKGVQSDQNFSRVKEHREVACLSTNEFFERIYIINNILNMYYNYNFFHNFVWKEFFFLFILHAHEYICLWPCKNGCDIEN